MKRHLVAILYSDDISLEGLQQQLEEYCNLSEDASTIFINASLFFSPCIFSPCFII